MGPIRQRPVKFVLVISFYFWYVSGDKRAHTVAEHVDRQEQELSDVQKHFESAQRRFSQRS
jgi:hypothetical protein